MYFCCFQQDGDVFLTGGASDEVWGTGGRTAADYDEAMTEEDSSGHYKGSMAAGIGAGVYQIVVYLQAGAGPANADVALAQGEIYWDGSAEVNPYTISETDIAAIIAKLPTNYIMGSSDQTDKDDDIDAILVDTGTTLPASIATAQADLDIITGTNGVLIDDDAITSDKFDEVTAFPVEKADTGSTEIARTGADSDTLETLSDQIDDVQTDVTTILANTGKVVYGSVYTSAGVKKPIADGSTAGFVEDEKL